MVYKRLVQIGRVAYINHGEEGGKLCVIVDVIDGARALVDGPCSNVKRQALSFKLLRLTDIVVKIPHSARTGTVKKAWDKEEVQKKWEATVWAQKIAAKKRRTELTDFERFKLMKAKQTRSRIINREFNKLKKAAGAAK
ncbi:60S ribosomal protein L14-like [Anneissia japonica]|uniref:60S ribosomal protein L14-like n=1 Tax=Anneissia japonica TaxID=1529436 RepID=UPI001425B34C|nr:60S ribosomal protein L14-like [Anneissia japonica]